MWEVSLVIVEFAGKVNYQGGHSKTLSVWAKPLSRAPFASSRGLSLNADAPHMVFPPVPDRKDVLGKKKTLYWLGSKFQHEGHTAKPNNPSPTLPSEKPPEWQRICYILSYCGNHTLRICRENKSPTPSRKLCWMFRYADEETFWKQFYFTQICNDTVFLGQRRGWRRDCIPCCWQHNVRQRGRITVLFCPRKMGPATS